MLRALSATLSRNVHRDWPSRKLGAACASTERRSGECIVNPKLPCLRKAAKDNDLLTLVLSRSRHWPIRPSTTTSRRRLRQLYASMLCLCGHLRVVCSLCSMPCDGVLSWPSSVYLHRLSQRRGAVDELQEIESLTPLEDERCFGPRVNQILHGCYEHVAIVMWRYQCVYVISSQSRAVSDDDIPHI